MIQRLGKPSMDFDARAPIPVCNVRGLWADPEGGSVTSPVPTFAGTSVVLKRVQVLKHYS